MAETDLHSTTHYEFRVSATHMKTKHKNNVIVGTVVNMQGEITFISLDTIRNFSCPRAARRQVIFVTTKKRHIRFEGPTCMRLHQKERKTSSYPDRQSDKELFSPKICNLASDRKRWIKWNNFMARERANSFSNTIRMI